MANNNDLKKIHLISIHVKNISLDARVSINNNLIHIFDILMHASITTANTVSCVTGKLAHGSLRGEDARDKGSIRVCV